MVSVQLELTGSSSGQASVLDREKNQEDILGVRLDPLLNVELIVSVPVRDNSGRPVSQVDVIVTLEPSQANILSTALREAVKMARVYGDM